MKPKNIFTTCFFIGILTFLYFYKFNKAINLKLELQYMALACGDCIPQYNVIYSSDSTLIEVNKQIDIAFVDEKLKSEYYNKVKNCEICMHIEVSGTLKWSMKSSYVFIADSFSVHENTPDCCD